MGRPPFLHLGAGEKSHQTPRSGSDVAGIGRQRRPQHLPPCAALRAMPDPELAAMTACSGKPLSRKFVLAAVAVCALLTPPAYSKSDELILRCKGSVGSFMPTVWTKDEELIAVHIKNRKITFSGNDFLSGNDMQLCPAETLGIPADTLYFDSDGCSTTTKSETRQYGTLNTILMKLDLTNTTDRIGVTGRFRRTRN
jgi:hypothetical protein